jgi:hypothetical protein
MRVVRVGDEVIRFESSRRASLFVFALIMLVTALWDWLTLGMPTDFGQILGRFTGQTGDAELPPAPIAQLIVALPWVLLPLAARHLWIALWGRVIVVDGIQRVITRNDKVLAGFDEIDDLEFRSWDDGNVRMKLCLRSGRKTRVGVICGDKQQDEVQGEIERLVRVAGPNVPEPSAQAGLFRMLSITYYVTRGASLLLLLGALLAGGMSLVYGVAGARTTATIVSNSPDAAQVIEFQDSAGLTHRFGAGAEASGYRLGDRLSVVYLPRDPSWHRVTSFGNAWGPTIFLGLFGAAMYAVSWFFGYFRLLGGFPTPSQSPSK